MPLPTDTVILMHSRTGRQVLRTFISFSGLQSAETQVHSYTLHRLLYIYFPNQIQNPKPYFQNSVTFSPSVHKINHKQHLEGTNMSDLTATHCGCNNTNTANNGCGCGSWIWILILLSCCGNNDGCGCGNGFFGNNGLFGGNDNNCCSWIWILILLSCCCGN